MAREHHGGAARSINPSVPRRLFWTSPFAPAAIQHHGVAGILGVMVLSVNNTSLLPRDKSCEESAL